MPRHSRHRCRAERAAEAAVDGGAIESGSRPGRHRLPSARTVGLAIGAGRAALGASFLAAPVASVRLLGLDTATARRVSWLAQMAAIRDGALGAGTLAATARGRGEGWLVAGAASDLTDAVVLSAALRQGKLRGIRPRAVVAGAVAAAALAGWAALGARRNR